MANYYCHARTNYFHVTDKDKLIELVKNIPGAELWDRTDNGVTSFAIANDNCIDQYVNEHDEMEDVTIEIQKLLPDNEVAIFIEAGHEKLHTVTGWGLVMTNKDYKLMSLSDILVQEARSLLGDPEYTCNDI